jgi:hypothetical protein
MGLERAQQGVECLRHAVQLSRSLLIDYKQKPMLQRSLHTHEGMQQLGTSSAPSQLLS